MSPVDAKTSMILMLLLLRIRPISQVISKKDSKLDWHIIFRNLFKMYFNVENELSQTTCGEDNVNTNLQARNKFE